MKTLRLALCLALTGGPLATGPVLAAPATALSAEVASRGAQPTLRITSAEGWNCTGTIEAAPGGKSRGGSSGGRSSSQATSVRLKCSDGTTARAQVRHNEARRQYDVNFSHKTHGAARLTARGN